MDDNYYYESTDNEVIKSFDRSITYFFYISSFFEFVIFIIIVVMIIKRIYNAKVNRNFFINNTVKSKNYKDISSDILKQYEIDNIDDLKKFLYKKFFDFEKAYNNLDFNTLRTLCDDKLYNNYHTKIMVESEAGKKRIIDNITKKDMIIYDILNYRFIQTIKTVIGIEYLDYTTDNNGNIIKGSKEKKNNEKFEVIFEKLNYPKKVTNCPNCGAPLENNSKCKYCQTTINEIQFVITSIKKII